MIKELWDGPRYTTEELNARLKFFIGIVLGLTLFGIVFVVLYSLIFVTQPMNGHMAAIDKVYTQQISTIMVFVTGVLGGVAGRSAVSASAKAIAKAQSDDGDEPKLEAKE